MTVQENALKVYYTSLTDSELLKIAANRISFIDAAQQAMEQELLTRHLSTGAAPLSESPGRTVGSRTHHGPHGLVGRLVRGWRG